ncbi:SigB/SigF/SigG family RNA polymerase sigma factor [Streptomyces sp. NPDC047968]|uniref:SigB/SigF/SigG family RNA polymerase sigma factor n=1 Tax=unclassified Streptomyces TaxID=2593676 RepID=UPI003430BF9C
MSSSLPAPPAGRAAASGGGLPPRGAAGNGVGPGTTLAALPPVPSSVGPADARPLSAVLLTRLAALEEGTAEYAYVRNTLVELNLSLVRYAAARFAHRSEPMEDVVQVGTVGLIKAINRFDPSHGAGFTSFALPTITGEIKRYFRDSSWSVRVPRRLQELRIGLARAMDGLEQELGHRPTTAELADRLHVSEAEVVEGELAANGYAAQSLDAAVGEDEGESPVARRLGTEDPAFALVEELQSLRPLIAALDERDRAILTLRFRDELTQAEIGERLGLSQMHVSRLLSGILARLRAGMSDGR